MKFDKLGLNDEILEAIDAMGFEEATEIQAKAIPLILEGKDMLACAQTGTGKTAAFILPILNEIAKTKDHHITHTLILVPTRELATQVDQQIQGFAYFTHSSSIAIYGGGRGQDFVQEKKALSSGANIVVATPGKLISHLNMGYVNFKSLKTLIMDEADRMLDIGFYDDIVKIISFLPKQRQNLMFSATMPSKISQLAKKILHNPEIITQAMSKPAPGVLQGVYHVYDQQKEDLLHDLISNKPNYKSILIFCSTKKKVGDLARSLKFKKYSVEGISSNLEQSQREEVLSSFRSKRTRILVATDVLSRGIDIKDINLVINYDVPGDAEDYIHRIGRTARAETTGVALTFVKPEDHYKFVRIEKLIGKPVPVLQLPAHLGEGPDHKKQHSRRSQGGRDGQRGRNFRKKPGGTNRKARR